MDLARLTDEEVVAPVRERDQEQYHELVQWYEARLLRYAAGRWPSFFESGG